MSNSKHYFNVPFDSNKNYVDRIGVSNILEKKMSTDNKESGSAKRVVLFGLGGSGKTEIAVHFAQQQRHCYKAVFWVNGVDEMHMNAGYRDICRVIGKVGGDNAYKPTWEAQCWLSSHRSWLLIFDNVDDDIAIDALRRKFLNVGMEGDVLITSRNPTTSAHWDGVEVSDMETHEAVTLLHNITGRREPGEKVAREKLLRDLGPLPLAVDQASSYILATEMSLQEYHSLFRREKSRLLNQFPSTLYNQESRETVMTTWGLSFQRVKSTDSQAAILMLILSTFSPTNITLEMLELGPLSLHHWAPNGEFEKLPKDQRWISSDMESVLGDQLRLREAISALRKFSLVHYKPDGKAIYIHPLVHYWASQQLSSDSREQMLKMCAIGLVASNFAPEERLLPVATPFISGDRASVLEEKSLRLWPWRQYHNLTAHALQCLQCVSTLSFLPESVAHLALSLLQVLDYISVDSVPEYKPDTSLPLDVDVLDHLAKVAQASDHYLEITIQTWRVLRLVFCHCRKQAWQSNMHCERCETTVAIADLLRKDLLSILDSVPVRTRVAISCLGKVISLEKVPKNPYPIYDHRSEDLATRHRGPPMLGVHRPNLDLPSDDTFDDTSDDIWGISATERRKRPMLGVSQPNLGRLTHDMSDNRSGDLATRHRKWPILGVPHPTLDSLADDVSAEGSEDLATGQPKPTILWPPTSRMEKYVHNVGVYLQLRSDSYVQLLHNSKVRVNEESAKIISMTFKDICGISEEYRRSAWYWTAELERMRKWQQIQDVLAPLVKQSVERPSLSWSHERCIIRLANALLEQHQIGNARQLLLDVQKSYMTAGIRLKSVDRHPLLCSQLDHMTVCPNPHS